jgi:hypothetical protein
MAAMSDRRWTGFGRIWVWGVLAVAVSACGAATSDEFDVAADATTARPGQAGDHPTREVEAAGPEAAPAQGQQALDQPAIWPAPDVVFATPEEAAADFVSAVLISEGDPLLGEFQQGDSRSGEIAVLFAGEAGDLVPPLEAGVLSLRQISPTDGWYVIAAISDGVVIDTPSALEEVPAGTVAVSGEGRDFEGTLAVSAFPPGDDAATLDLEIGAGGALADLEPYSVELDLSGAAGGDVVVILVRGDTGLANDPSTFAAIPIVIASALPTTIPPTR